MSSLAHASTADALNEILARRIVVLDGAMGSTILSHGLKEVDYRGKRFSISFGSSTSHRVRARAIE